MSPLIVRRTILAELARSAQYALPQPQLLEQVNLRLRPALAPDELTAHLSWLLDRELADFLPDDLEPDNAATRKWLIKEAGLAALRK